MFGCFNDKMATFSPVLILFIGMNVFKVEGKGEQISEIGEGQYDGVLCLQEGVLENTAMNLDGDDAAAVLREHDFLTTTRTECPLKAIYEGLDLSEKFGNYVNDIELLNLLGLRSMILLGITHDFQKKFYPSIDIQVKWLRRLIPDIHKVHERFVKAGGPLESVAVRFGYQFMKNLWKWMHEIVSEGSDLFHIETDVTILMNLALISDTLGKYDEMLLHSKIGASLLEKHLDGGLNKCASYTVLLSEQAKAHQKLGEHRKSKELFLKTSIFFLKCVDSKDEVEKYEYVRSVMMVMAYVKMELENYLAIDGK